MRASGAPAGALADRRRTGGRETLFEFRLIGIKGSALFWRARASADFITLRTESSAAL